MKSLIIFAFLFFPFFALAEVHVAFIEMRDASGKIVQLEPGGRFAHTAISYAGEWLQAHPWRGVERVSRAELEKMGRIGEIVVLKEHPALSASQVTPFLGRPFDRRFSWDDEAIYCSELIGKILGLEPEPMTFDPRLWPPEYAQRNGELGLSPDGIYRLLRR